jgi:hypothetical protein
MKFSHSLAFLVAAALTVPPALADFHVILRQPDLLDYTKNTVIACPSNYYNCRCIQGGDRRVTIGADGGEPKDLPDGYFYTEGKFCGVGKLNFYERSDGHWQFYKDGGDGSLQGECWSNTKSPSTCGNIAYSEQLVCYSYICGKS